MGATVATSIPGSDAPAPRGSPRQRLGLPGERGERRALTRAQRLSSTARPEAKRDRNQSTASHRLAAR